MEDERSHFYRGNGPSLVSIFVRKLDCYVTFVVFRLFYLLDVRDSGSYLSKHTKILCRPFSRF